MTEQACDLTAAERLRLRLLWSTKPEPTACTVCGSSMVYRDMASAWYCRAAFVLLDQWILSGNAENVEYSDAVLHHWKASKYSTEGNPEALGVLDALERAEQERDAAWERLEACDTLHGHALGEVKTLTEERDQANAGVVVLLLKFERIYDFHNARGEDGPCTCEWCEIYRDLQTDAAATDLLKRAGRAVKLASAALLAPDLNDGQGRGRGQA